jgi:cytidylate kinase
MIIAIDGPSGAGKSTLGKRLAKELKLLYIDTGAMYRAVAFACLEAGVDLEDKEAVAKIARQSEITLAGEPDSLQVFLNGRDVSQEIRTDVVSQGASRVSVISEVRRTLVERQRILGNQGAGCVMDGRDIGTIVFPNADIKFFLTALPESRAQRRYKEDLEKNRAVKSYEETLTDIIERDTRDTTRADSPLVKANDAIEIDSSNMTIDEVVEKMLRVVCESQYRLR